MAHAHADVGQHREDESTMTSPTEGGALARDKRAPSVQHTVSAALISLLSDILRLRMGPGSLKRNSMRHEQEWCRATYNRLLFGFACGLVLLYLELDRRLARESDEARVARTFFGPP